MASRRKLLGTIVVFFALATVGAPSSITLSQDAPPAACRLDGTWTFTAPGAAGPVAGQPGRLVVRGTTATVSFGEPATATVTMRARVADGVVQLNDQRSTPASLRCTDPEAGQYRLGYTPDCGQLTLELLYEPCPGRRGALAGTTLTRAADAPPSGRRGG